MTYPVKASDFGTALQFPECGQQRQLISNRRNASRAPAEYGPTTFGEISARNSRNTGPTAVLKHCFAPNVFADARAHAIIIAMGTYAPTASIPDAPRTAPSVCKMVRFEQKVCNKVERTKPGLAITKCERG